MTAPRLILRSLTYFRAAHAALLAGMILVTAVLTGALILGDSVSDSLSDLSNRRRGVYEEVVTAPGFFSEGLAQRTDFEYDAGLALPGRARSERTTLSSGVQLLAATYAAPVPQRKAWITRAVAESLNVTTGDALLITLPKPAEGSADALLARRDRTSLGSLRVTVERILDERTNDKGEAFLAWFDLHPSQRAPANVWLNMADLQEALQADIPLENRIPKSPANILLHAKSIEDIQIRVVNPRTTQPHLSAPYIDANGFRIVSGFPLNWAMTLEDYGLELSRRGETGDVAILRSGNVYIPPQIAAALHPFKTTGQEVYTLLLDRVTTDNPASPSLSYVIATGITGHDDLGLKDNQLAVNQWTADQLQLKLGDTLHVNPYHVAGDTVTVAPASTFKLARILPMTALGADPSLTPTFHGLTDADTIAKWNPPANFPFDRTRVTPADETYWKEYKAAPKIFFNLIAAQRLVKPATPLTPAGDSAGELTSLRLPAAQAQDFVRAMRTKLTPQAAGFVHLPFAPDQPASTDFASLFLGLSGFLLIAALLLVVLLFRLAVDQRARQIGLLGALGFTPRRIARLILIENALIALLGAILGLPAAVAYTRLLIQGLGSWWIGATGTHAITLHLHPATLALGSAISLAAALLALALSARRLTKLTPLSQLQGQIATPSKTTDPSRVPRVWPNPTNSSSAAQPFTNQEHSRDQNRQTRAPRTPSAPRTRLILPLLALLLSLSPLLLTALHLLQPPLAFLLTGFLLLTLSILLLARLPLAPRRVRQTLTAIAIASILRQRTRAILCVALMAAAAFLLTSVTAFESTPTTPTAPPSPTGGYQLMLTTQIPLPADLQTPAGRKLLGIPEDPLFAAAHFTALPVKPGDDISCLNMTRPTTATLVGAPPELLNRLAIADQRPLQPGDTAIPAAVDQQTAQYILHAALGDPLPAATSDHPILITTLLDNSIFQSYALIPEADFHRAFPAITRPSLILVDCPASDVPALQKLLRTHLDDFGITVETTTQRLATYHAVADSYIAAFQFLGSLALLVGTLGLVVVLARTVIQRRSELALLQALGFTRQKITLLLVIEHAILLTLGLALGIATALLATLPQIRQVHLTPVALATAIILLTGFLVLTAAAQAATHRLTPAALRQE